MEHPGLWSILAYGARLSVISDEQQIQSKLLSGSSPVEETVNKHTIKCVITDCGKCYGSMREKIEKPTKCVRGGPQKLVILRNPHYHQIQRQDDKTMLDLFLQLLCLALFLTSPFMPFAFSMPPPLFSFSSFYYIGFKIFNGYFKDKLAILISRDLAFSLCNSFSS